VQNGWQGVMGEDDLKAFADAGIPPALVQEDRKHSALPEILEQGRAVECSFAGHRVVV
jgi:hypothetical protein